MPFKDTGEGQTHYYGDGCPEHSDDIPMLTRKIEALNATIKGMEEDIKTFGAAGDDVERLARKKKELEGLEDMLFLLCN